MKPEHSHTGSNPGGLPSSQMEARFHWRFPEAKHITLISKGPHTFCTLPVPIYLTTPEEALRSLNVVQGSPASASGGPDEDLSSLEGENSCLLISEEASPEQSRGTCAVPPVSMGVSTK